MHSCHHAIVSMEHCSGVMNTTQQFVMEEFGADIEIVVLQCTCFVFLLTWLTDVAPARHVSFSCSVWQCA